MFGSSNPASPARFTGCLVALFLVSTSSAVTINLSDELDLGTFNSNTTETRTILTTSTTGFDAIDNTFDGVVIYSFTVKYDETDGIQEFAGLSLFDGGSENLGITNRFSSDMWSYFRAAFISANEADLQNAGGDVVTIAANDPKTFTVQINYNVGAVDSASILFDGKTTLLPDGNYSFDSVRVRARNVKVDYTDISFTIIPEPATLMLLGLGGVVLAHRSRS